MAKKKILVVDDELDFLKIMSIRLEASGYEVVTASNGKEALAIIRSGRPDAVLLDILMPDLSGLEVLKKIRKTDKKLPVFMITAFSSDERFKVANKLSASGFIVKTGDLKDEVDSITSALDLAGKYKAR
ncbi:MAG: response regulator [Candidatus Omnitrophota bacterium]